MSIEKPFFSAILENFLICAFSGRKGMLPSLLLPAAKSKKKPAMLGA